MAKKTCYWLNKEEMSGIQIRNDGNMYPCSIRWIPLSDEPSKYKDYKNLSFDDIQNLRKNLLDEINNGEHSECQNCPLLHEYTGCGESIGAIKHLIYHPHTLCTLDCKYCFYTSEQKNIPIPKEYEDVYETIKHFYDIGLLNKEYFYLDLGGGEPTLLRNIDKTVKFMSKTWEYSTFSLLSNSTVTEKVKQLSKSLKGKYKNVRKILLTSLDCGTETTYYEIRRKNCYRQTVKNIYTYVRNKVFDEIILKYIFLDDLSNADDDDIYGFLHLCRSLNRINKTIITISLDIDWFSRKHNDDDIPDEILKVIGKLYYFITEVLLINYCFASDYLNTSTLKGTIAVEKVLMYAEEFKNQKKTKRELREIKLLSKNWFEKLIIKTHEFITLCKNKYDVIKPKIDKKINKFIKTCKMVYNILTAQYL